MRLAKPFALRFSLFIPRGRRGGGGRKWPSLARRGMAGPRVKWSPFMGCRPRFMESDASLHRMWLETALLLATHFWRRGGGMERDGGGLRVKRAKKYTTSVHLSIVDRKGPLDQMVAISRKANVFWRVVEDSFEETLQRNCPRKCLWKNKYKKWIKISTFSAAKMVMKPRILSSGT